MFAAASNTSVYLYQSAGKAPSFLPTVRPTGPSAAPTAATFMCPAFNVSGENSYATCSFNACGGTQLIITLEECSGDSISMLLYMGSTLVYSWYVGAGGKCPISLNKYVVPGHTCVDYTIHEGCYSGAYKCAGDFSVGGSTSGLVNSAPPPFYPTPAPSVPVVIAFDAQQVCNYINFTYRVNIRCGYVGCKWCSLRYIPDQFE